MTSTPTQRNHQYRQRSSDTFVQSLSCFFSYFFRCRFLFSSGHEDYGQSFHLTCQGSRLILNVLKLYQETHIRSLLKAFSWRVTGTLATTLIVFVLTRRLEFALVAGGADFLSKIALYFLHERLWDQVGAGRLANFNAAKPFVIWMTGLPAAGKTTIANALTLKLKSAGLNVEQLDGDTIRKIFPNTGYSKEDRMEHLNRVGYLASRLEQNGVFVVASLISPYKESRFFVRGLCKNFLEIYISTPLSECENRDPKGLYKQARAGTIKNFTGIDAPYEVPETPELIINTSEVSVESAVQRILDLVKLKSTT